jgi:hypothetical protein
MQMPTFFSKLPSIVWVILLPLGLIAFIGSIILIFNLVATVEGVASIIFLIIGFLTIGGASATTKFSGISEGKASGAGFAVAVGIVFFAIMGMAIDQPGNYIYNKPVEWVYCQNGTSLSRGVDVTHPLPGRTDITQDFSCKDTNGVNKYEINMFGLLGIRFVEYVLIGYGLIGLHRLINILRQKLWQKQY